MQRKTMNQIIEKKVNQWLTTIESKELRNTIRNDVVITGGCFPAMILGDMPNDFDCYFKTKETALKVANYYADLWNESHRDQRNKLGMKCDVMVLDGENPSQKIIDYYRAMPGKVNALKTGAVIVDNCPSDRIKMVFPSDGIVGNPEEVNCDEELGTDPMKIVTELDEIDAEEEIKKEKKPYFPVFISSNAITLSNKIQIVIRFYGDPENIHDTFDFEHTRAYWTNDTKTVIPNKVWETTINKVLVYTGSKYPVCSVFRLRKFIARGWKINAGQILKMAMQISELNLHDINVLEDQLIGVDSLYFMNLIEQFRKKKNNDPSWELTTDYIISIIDKIF